MDLKVNIFFSTQGASLDLFYQVDRYLRERLPDFRTGYLVCDSRHYDRFCRTHPEFPAAAHVVLKEWEVLEEAKKSALSFHTLRSYERRLGSPNLWGPLLADRRIYLGKRATYRQDYKPRFTHEEMLAILQQALIEFNRISQDFQPDAVMTLYPAPLVITLPICWAGSWGPSRWILD